MATQQNCLSMGLTSSSGEPSLFNKGYGTKMIKQFGDTIQADAIILETAISNVRAIRCYVKCGFCKVKQIKNGAAWLMERS